jgi:hypothetical protein
MVRCQIRRGRLACTAGSDSWYAIGRPYVHHILGNQVPHSDGR